MKVLLVLAVCLAAVSAAPAQRSQRAIDYSAVQAKVKQIEDATRAGVNKVKETASNDNEQVGQTIAEIIDNAAAEALAVLAKAQKEIADETLTEEGARNYLAELKAILAKVQLDLADLVAQLSAAAAAEIRAIFQATFAEVEAYANELYALLSQVSLARAVDWSAVQANVAEIQKLTEDAVNDVKEAASSDNEQVGQAIAEIIDRAAAKAKAVLELAGKEIADQTLTVEGAKAYLEELQGILDAVRVELQDQLAQLSEAAVLKIRGIFDVAFAAVEYKAQQLYVLLAQ